jgi:hypothetical protein
MASMDSLDATLWGRGDDAEGVGPCFVPVAGVETVFSYAGDGINGLLAA